MSLTTTTSTIPTRLGRLAVRSIGDGPPAVFWHSLFVDSRSWDRVVPALSEHRRLVLVDGPGWGHSEPLRHRTTMAECALAAEDLLDGLVLDGVVDPGPVDWVGNAWGGHIGYRLAGTRPERLRSLVAASAPTSPLPDRRRRLIGVLSRLVSCVGVRGPLRRAVAGAQLTDATRSSDPLAAAVLNSCLDDADRRSIAQTMRSFIVRRNDLGDELRRSPVRTLLLAGDDRGDLSPAQARDCIVGCRDARVVVVGASRTLIPLERPVEFSEAVLGFWAGP